MRLIRLGLMTALFLSATSLLFAQQLPRGEHGQTLERVQETEFLRLQRGGYFDIESPVPYGVDRDYWNSLVPEGNETTEARYALGKKLYFDTRLSIDGTVSCATCHDVTRGFGDALPTSEGVDKMVEGGGKVKQFGTRNAPTTMNIALLHSMFWDGRSPTIEHQAMQPIINPVEMGMPNDEATIIANIKDDPEYQKMFQDAYGHGVNYQDIGNALAVFERSFVFMDNPFFRNVAEISERVRRGEKIAGDQFPGFSPEAWEGWKIFNREGRCNSCHQISPSNPLGTDNKFHNIGVAAHNRDFDRLASEAIVELKKDSSDEALDKLALTTDMGELGRFMITKNLNDMGAFRTPILLNVGITGPYMHDGSFKTLWDVVDHYNKGGIPNAYLDGGIEPLNLTDRQVDALVAFLFALTDVRFAEQNQREFMRQRMIANQSRPERDNGIASRKTLSFEKYHKENKGGDQ